MRAHHLKDLGGSDDGGRDTAQSYLADFDAADRNQWRPTGRAARLGKSRRLGARHGDHRSGRIHGDRGDPIAIGRAARRGDIGGGADRNQPGGRAGAGHARRISRQRRDIDVIVAGGGGRRNDATGGQPIRRDLVFVAGRLTPRLGRQRKNGVIAGIGHRGERVLRLPGLVFDG